MSRRALIIGASVALACAGLATAAAAQEADPPHPVHIHAGACPDVGDVVTPLADLVVGTDDAVGSAAAIPVEASTNTVDMALSDIVGAEHAINAHESADAMENYIACGDVGGNMFGASDLVIGLAEQNGSGHFGSAWLHDNGDGTTRVDVVLYNMAGAAPAGSPAAESPAAESPAAESPMAPAESPMAPAESPVAESPMAPAESPAAESPSAS
jgi:hypothetical protein